MSMVFAVVVGAVIGHFFDEAIGIKWDSSPHLGKIFHNIAYIVVGAGLALWLLK